MSCCTNFMYKIHFWHYMFFKPIMQWGSSILCPILIIQTCCFCICFWKGLSPVLFRKSRSVCLDVGHVSDLFLLTPEGSLNEIISYSQRIWVMSFCSNEVSLGGFGAFKLLINDQWKSGPCKIFFKWFQGVHLIFSIVL